MEVYHCIEDVIARSVRTHERHEREQRTAACSVPTGDAVTALPPALNKSALLRLVLNDWTCGIAVGTCFCGVHSVMLYGTLLALELSNVRTLYHPFCPNVPSLVNSAIAAFCLQFWV